MTFNLIIPLILGLVIGYVSGQIITIMFIFINYIIGEVKNEKKGTTKK
jgi:hypothetical protein